MNYTFLIVIGLALIITAPFALHGAAREARRRWP